MILRQLFDNTSSTYTYLLGCEVSKQAVLIDTVFEQVNRDMALLHELGLDLLYVLDTHCHADHVTGAWLLKQKTGCTIACAEAVGAANVDFALNHGDRLDVGELSLDVRATPGHTSGCLTFVCDQLKMAFTGDTLLIRGCGRCDFQQGDASNLFDSIQNQIFTLPDDYLLYPGHDYAGRTVTSVAEERQFNTRLGGEASKQDFTGFMNNMILPHPKFIDIALPANLKCGKPDSLPTEPNWAPLQLTFAGIYEVEPLWVYQNQNVCAVIDVRELGELDECALDFAIHIPLAKLTDNISMVPKDKPVLVICRSGRRSALAVNMLKQSGLENLANIRGGIIAWQQSGLPCRAKE